MHSISHLKENNYRKSKSTPKFCNYVIIKYDVCCSIEHKGEFLKNIQATLFHIMKVLSGSKQQFIVN